MTRKALDEELVDQLMDGLVSILKKRRRFACVCCGAAFEVGGWCFYRLCPGCFEEFDGQKMRGRAALASGEERPADSTESLAEWMEWRKS